jgi:glutaredoxin
MITLYTKPACPYCEMAKTWFQTNNFEYSEIDVTQDAKSLAFVKGNGHKTVPQIYLNNNILVSGGFEGLKGITPEELRKRME